MEEANDPKQIVSRVFGLEGVELFENLLSQEPQHADAIVFLQGDRFDRAKRVISLYKEKYADQVFIVGNNVLAGEGKRPGENNVSLEEMAAYIREKGIPLHSIIVNYQAMNTLGQARETIHFAKERKWNVLLIVVSPYHVLRAYLTFVKQAKEQRWQGKVVFQIADLPWDKAPSGRSSTALELLHRELEKIKAYQKDLSTVGEGVVFMQEMRESCSIRKVRKEDSRKIWEIRNSSLVRQMSSSQDLVPFENHVVWFGKTYFTGQRNICFVIECKGEVVGYCRFDFHEKENAYLVSVAVNSSYHGRGLGSRILSEALLQLPEGVLVNAAVKKGNLASIKLFEKNKFVIDHEDEQYYYLHLIQKA